MTTQKKLSFLSLALLSVQGGAAALAIAPDARAQSYPDRNIRVIVPWPPGGLVDIAARTITDKAKDDLKQSFIIENRAGAGGAIGAAAVAKADPDGYTLMFTTSGLTMNASLGKAPYDVVRDFTPILLIANVPQVLVTHNGLKVNSVGDLIGLAKAKPGEITYASAGLGSPAHFTAELFRQLAGISLIHVPYKGAPEAMNDLIGERIAFQFTNATVAVPQVQAGKIKALAISSERRSTLIPAVPTMKEAGFGNFNADQWLGVLAPARTPKLVVDTISAAMKKALGNEDVKSVLIRNAMEIDPASTPATFATFLEKDARTWVDVAKSAKLRAN